MWFVSLASLICLARSSPKRYLVDAVIVSEKQRAWYAGLRAGLSFSCLKWDNSWAACPRRAATSMLFVINSFNCNAVLLGSFFMPKSLSVVITVANIAFCKVCWRFTMRRSAFLWAAFNGAQISGFTCVTVTSEQFSGGEYFSIIEVIFSGASFLAHRLFTIAASCFVTLGPFFSSSIRPALSSVSNLSLTSVWASVDAPGSLLVHRSSFTSSSNAVMLIASTLSFEDLCRTEESSSKSEEDTLWRRFRPLVLEHGGPRFSHALGMGRCSQIWPKWVVSLPKLALNFTNAACILSSWPCGWFIWLSSPKFSPSGGTGAIVSVLGCVSSSVLVRARKLAKGEEIVRVTTTKYRFCTELVQYLRTMPVFSSRLTSYHAIDLLACACFSRSSAVTKTGNEIELKATAVLVVEKAKLNITGLLIVNWMASWLIINHFFLNWNGCDYLTNKNWPSPFLFCSPKRY